MVPAAAQENEVELAQKNRSTVSEYISVIFNFLKFEFFLVMLYLYFRNYDLGYNDRDKEQFMI